MSELIGYFPYKLDWLLMARSPIRILVQPAILGNAVSWLLYGFTISNPWIIFPNAFNLFAGAYFTKSGLALAEKDDHNIIVRTLLAVGRRCFACLHVLVSG